MTMLECEKLFNKYGGSNFIKHRKLDNSLIMSNVFKIKDINLIRQIKTTKHTLEDALIYFKVIH